MDFASRDDLGRHVLQMILMGNHVLTRAPYPSRRNLLKRELKARSRARWLAVSFVVSCGLALGLLTGAGTEAFRLQPYREQVFNLAQPVLSFLQRAVAAVWNEPGLVVARRTDDKVVAKLRRRVAELEVWQLRAEQLEGKLEELGKLAKVITGPNLPFVTGEVLGLGGGLSQRTLLVAVGTDHGVRVGQPVISAKGFIGIIGLASQRMSEIWLTHDPRLTIEVMVGAARKRGVVRGNGQLIDQPSRAKSLSRSADMSLEMPAWDLRQTAVGDLVVTSGDRGRLPRGLRLGRVVQAPGALGVAPFAAAETLRFVSVLGFTPLVTSEAADHQGPSGAAPGGSGTSEISTSSIAPPVRDPQAGNSVAGVLRDQP
ncbi:MAG: rod shape-determining protein MreC [Pseudomonadota bacterium]